MGERETGPWLVVNPTSGAASANVVEVRRVRVRRVVVGRGRCILGGGCGCACGESVGGYVGG